MSRLPIRARLTLAFALAMGLVLAATGAFVYARLGAALDEGVNESLDSRLVEISRSVRDQDAVTEIRTEESFARVLDPAEAEAGSLFSRSELSQIRAGRVFRVEHGRTRLWAARSDGKLVVAGASLEDV